MGVFFHFSFFSFIAGDSPAANKQKSPVLFWSAPGFKESVGRCFIAAASRRQT
jgi:hypothetical protein